MNQITVDRIGVDRGGEVYLCNRLCHTGRYCNNHGRERRTVGARYMLVCNRCAKVIDRAQKKAEQEAEKTK